MAPQWMPQNIQKRLLLCVLQQLSLFSEIDLPNLDVSLGSNSQITLTDIQLETDAFQIPGVHFRNGTIQSLKLQLNMSDGVNIEGEGLSLTVSLASSLSSSATDSASLSHSELHGERSRFSLAQSTLDLANSIMIDEVPDSPHQSIHESPEIPISSSPTSGEQQQSTLNAMMAKAVEVALSKLNVKLKNINLRVVLDHATIDVYIESATFVTVDGVKKVDVYGISVVGVHPTAEPGDEGHLDIGKARADEEQKENEQVQSEESDGSDDDDDDDDVYESMATSSILERPKESDLAKSRGAEHGDDYSSIYMSATSNVFESRRQELSKSTKLLFITSIKFEFEGSSTPDNLTIDIDEIRIPSTPLPLTLLHIIESLSVLNSVDVARARYSDVGQKLKEQREKQEHIQQSEVPKSTAFNFVKVNKIVFDFVSALNDYGEFCLHNGLRLIGENLEIQQKDSKLIYGNLLNFYLLDDGKKVGVFEGDETRFDIRFEYLLSTNDFTLLLPKNLEVHLNQSNLQNFIKFTSLFPQIVTSLDKLNRAAASRPSKPSTPSIITVQTSLISLVLHISPETALKLKVTPISYDSGQSSLSINKIQLSQISQEEDTPLLTVFNTSLQSHKTEKQVRSFDNTGHEIVITTGSSLSITNVEITHDSKLINNLFSALGSFFDGLSFPVVEPIFKTRKKARISSNLTFQTRQSVKLFSQIGSLSFKISNISEKFGDINGSFNNIAIIIQKDNAIQLHVLNGGVTRNFGDAEYTVLEVINPDDKISPILSAKTKNFKDFNVFLRNVGVDYYAKWLGLFDDEKSKNLEESSDIVISSGSASNTSKIGLKINVVDCGIGLNPSRLSAKAIFVIPNGNIDLIISQAMVIKSDLRNPSILLIDDAANVLGHDEAKKNRNIKTTWSQATFLKTKGFTSVAEADSLDLVITIKQSISTAGNRGDASKHTLLDIEIGALTLELCADSSQCLLQLLNDLKQPIVINPESKYKINRSEGGNVFDGVEEDAFNEQATIDHTAASSSANGPLNFVDSYYDNDSRGYDDGSSDKLLDKDLSDFTIRENALSKNPFYTGGNNTLNGESNGDIKSENSDSIILFNDGHFEENGKGMNGSSSAILYPLALNLLISKVTLKIYDGYDWKYTRKSINNAVLRLEKRVKEERNLRPQPSTTNGTTKSIIGETLFDSIIVGLPLNTEDPSQLTSKINKNLQNLDDTIDVGKNNVKKLRLRRTKFHKVLVELEEVNVKFTIFSNQDPTDSTTTNSDDYELVNEVVVVVKDFEVIDNVPTSTWNKFVTLLKEVDREDGSSMLKLKMTTIRPVMSLAATEFLMDVEVLPLRLHVDQDTLEVLTRFGEFKDSRFLLIDEFEDIAYIQKFHVNSVPIKLDYKPKKVDYAGLRSGRTTEFMNFFILDEAFMVLKEVTLYGISGFPKLGLLLNSLWTPDIKQTQLSGVLAGLAPVRSIANIGAGFKDLIIVPVQEYKKDGRIYRSLSKGVQQFTRNTTNELLKFGIKLTAGTQTLLENTEEALGGVGSSARLPIERTTITEEPEEEEEQDDDWNLQSSQLIGGSAPSNQQPLHRSIYQPTLESIADINEDPYATVGISSPRKANPRNLIRQPNSDIDGYDEEDESQRTISLYANQPKTLKQGLLLAYDSLGRNFLVARDAIRNAGSEISESGTAHDTTLAVVKATPVALLRPMIGATEAASKALLGINNQFDPQQAKYIDDKYKQVTE